jgi:hypothetical protein
LILLHQLISYLCIWQDAYTHASLRKLRLQLNTLGRPVFLHYIKDMSISNIFFLSLCYIFLLFVEIKCMRRIILDQKLCLGHHILLLVH